MNRHRIHSAAAVATIAAANRVPFTSSPRAASVRVGGDVFFWAAS